MDFLRNFGFPIMLALMLIGLGIFIAKMEQEVLDGCCDFDEPIMNLDGNLY